MRTREVRGIGRLEGSGSGLSAGLPPRTLFYRQVQENGVRKCSGPEAISRSDLSGTLGPKLGGRAPSFQRFLRFSESSPGIFFVPETPPGKFRRIPPALTSVLRNGFLLRRFPSFSRRHLPSFLFPLPSSSLVVRYLSPICPLPNLPISRPPHLLETGAAEPAVFGGPRKRRKFPGGMSPEQRRFRGNLR